MIYSYQHEGQTYTVDLRPNPDGSFKATVGDKHYTVRAQAAPDGAWVVWLEDSRALIYSAGQGSDRFLHYAGSTYCLRVPDARSGRQKSASAGGGASLNAQMPGQVIAVYAAAGDRVEKGQTLVVLEAMKMEIRVAAPNAGTIHKMLVGKGDMVERGQLLVELT